VSVVDGFLYILNDMFLSSLEMVMSKNLILLSFSSSIVNFIIGITLLNIMSTSCTLVIPFL